VAAAAGVVHIGVAWAQDAAPAPSASVASAPAASTPAAAASAAADQRAAALAARQRVAASALGACLRQPPPYPERALRDDASGRTVVAFSMADDGTPAGAELATSSGHALLDEAALAHVRRCMAAARARTPAEVLPAGTFRVPYVWRVE
jgi:protein TonB